MNKPKASIERSIKTSVIFLLLASFQIVPARNCLAQTEEHEPLFERLLKDFKKDYLSLGALLQTVGDFQVDRSFAGNNGFNISNFRIVLYGELDKSFGYFLQTNFIKSPAILDAKLYYRFSKFVAIDAGLFKSPFSAEFLIGAANIDFVNRSQVVTLLAPGRQIGVQLRGSLSQKPISYQVGLFNGNGFDGNNNDNNKFLYAGRLTFHPVLSDPSSRLEFGLNLAYSEDDNATIGSGFVPGFNGERLLIGGDTRWTLGRYLISSEIIYGNLDPSSGLSSEMVGFHTTLGYMLNDKNQLLFRTDNFDPDRLGTDSHLIIFGYNYWPTKATEIQVNYIINTDKTDIDHHQLLINAQISF